MNNKALLGLFVVLIAIFAFLYFMRTRVDLLGFGNFSFVKSFQSQEKVATDSGSLKPANDAEATTSADGEVAGTSEEYRELPEQTPETGTTSEQTDEVFNCSLEMYAKNCAEHQHVPVCGHERVVTANGDSSTRALTYISACHYCRLFSPDGHLVMGDRTVHAAGYEAGACAQ